MNLVEDYEPILMLFQIEFRLCQFGPVGRQFQVHVKSFFPERPCQGHGKRRFAYLPGSKDGYSRKLFEQARYFGLNLPRNDHLAIMLHRFIFARMRTIEWKRSQKPIPNLIREGFYPSAETSTPTPPLGTTRWAGLWGTFRLALSGAAPWLVLMVDTFP